MSERDQVVMEVLHALRSISDAMDRMHGLVGADMELNTTDLRAMRMLIIREQSAQTTSPHELARHLRISTASTSKLVDRLAAAGHVERSPHPRDRRARVVTLTDESKRSFFQHYGGHLGVMRGVAERYDEADLRVISRFLDELAVEIDPQ